jgi:hypothetical protein
MLQNRAPVPAKGTGALKSIRCIPAESKIAEGRWPNYYWQEEFLPYQESPDISEGGTPQSHFLIVVFAIIFIDINVIRQFSFNTRLGITYAFMYAAA